MPLLDPMVTFAVLLAAALVGGMIAHRLRQPVILGYLVIGILVGPHSLGMVGNVEIIETAAAIGVALLMFTLGLEISITQLREVGRVGLWGGVAQIGVTFALGLMLGILLFGWDASQAVLFGLIVALSSTAVCLKILMERGELNSVPGRIMIAFLILQDISVVLMMVALPLMSRDVDNLVLALGMAVGKTVFFVGIAIVMGRWVLPWLMGRVGGVRARELFLLTVLIMGLGAAIGTHIFGLSMVFGAFLVGLVLRETRFVHQALAEITPLRDVFATLFFVSLGMLLDPAFVVSRWTVVLLAVSVIIFIKFCVIFGIVRLFGYSNRVAFITGAGLFQIGEFGFILAQGGIDIGIISEEFYSVILASAVISMLLTPLSISLAVKFSSRLALLRAGRMSGRGLVLSPAASSAGPPNRVIVAGYGRVGQNVARGLQDAGVPFTVLDIDPERVSEARECGCPRIYGDATNVHVLSKANLGRACALVVTYPDPMAVITTVKIALKINPDLEILARVHRLKEAEILRGLGVKELVSPEYEASFRFIKRLLNITGFESVERKRLLARVRRDKQITEFNPDDTE